MGRRPATTAGFTMAEVMRLTGATKSKIEYWTKLYLAKRGNSQHHCGTGHYRTYSNEDVALFSEAMRASQIWGASAAIAVIRDGALLPHGISEDEWMTLRELRSGRAKVVPVDRG